MLRLTNIIFLSFLSYSLFAQKCDKSIKGIIKDETTNEALPFASIYVIEDEKAAIADQNGYFELNGICSKAIHIQVSHVGCEPLKLFLTISQDSTFEIALHHHEELLNETIIHGQKSQETLEKSSVIDRDVILQKAASTLADISATVPGVSILKTGSNVQKPIIQGLYGNRIAILNNGLQQGGQQWGNDHSPEVDPSMADHVAVIKGSNALAYSGTSLGGVILIETESIGNDPHLHGEINSSFQTNTSSTKLNARFEKYTPKIAWRAGFSGKVAGDGKSPDYFLTNTANQEVASFLQLERNIFKKIETQAIYSFFQSKLGILRGASIGNVSDLNLAFERTIPFFTEDERSFKINAPSQRVSHHLATLKLERKANKNQIVAFRYGFQLNLRDEFDVRRAGRSDLPSLSLNQTRHEVDLKYTKGLGNNDILKSGFNYSYINNINQPETGILPLIPDYLSHQSGLYLIYNKEIKKTEFEIGARSDYKYFDVAYIKRAAIREVEKLKNKFINTNFTTGIKHKFNEEFSINLNLGYSERAPEINELYSNGLHQGISSIELGNRTLHVEKSFKSVLSLDLALENKFFFQSSLYAQKINDFIFLKPNLEPLLTIRGAFPVFEYNQTDAMLAGADLLLSYSPILNTKVITKYACVIGNDLLADNSPLIFIPPGNLDFRIEQRISGMGNLKENNVSVGYQFVQEQKRFSLIQDFAAPPKAFSLVNINLGSSIYISKNNVVKLNINIDNLFNVKYRNYLNRQRYFADEMGRNISIIARYKF